MRITVIHRGALGDFLLALPIFEGLYALRSDVRLSFGIRGDFAELIRRRPWFSGFFSSDDPALSLLYHDEAWRETRLPPLLAESEIVFLFARKSGPTVAERLSSLLSRPVYGIDSFPSPEEHPDTGVTDYLLHQMHRYDRQIPRVATRLFPSPLSIEAVRPLLPEVGTGPLIVIHAGSGGKSKIPPLPRWWNLLSRIHREVSPNIIMTLGPADESLTGFVCAAGSRFGVVHPGVLDLPRLAALLASASLYIGCDSGVSHLAGVMGTPSVVIFGPTDPKVWAPNGSHVRIVVERWSEEEIFVPFDSTPSQPEDAVFEAVISLLALHHSVG